VEVTVQAGTGREKSQEGEMMNICFTRRLQPNDELTRGEVYLIRLTDGRWVKARFERVHLSSWLKSRTMKHYMFVNLRTDRDIEIKSRERIRVLIDECPNTKTEAVGAEI
jgi:hypothetical protein